MQVSLKFYNLGLMSTDDDTIRYEMLFFDLRSKADMSQLNLPLHGNDN